MKKFILNSKIILLSFLVALSVLMFASCGVKTSIVTFDTDGGSPVETVEVVNGDFILPPETPIKDGWEFIAWTLPNGETWYFNENEVTEDITLIATWRCLHKYDHACDTTCNTIGCGYVRETEHLYDHACDATCNIIGCDYERTISHNFTNSCDRDCNKMRKFS